MITKIHSCTTLKDPKSTTNYIKHSKATHHLITKCCFTSIGLRIGSMFRSRAKMKGTQHMKMVKAQRLSKRGKIVKSGWQIWLYSQNKGMLLSHYYNAYARCDSKKIKASSRDVIMKETKIKEKHETNGNKLALKAQILIGYLPKTRGSLLKMSGVRIEHKYYTLD